MEHRRNRAKVYGKTSKVSEKHGSTAAIFAENILPKPVASSNCKPSSVRQPLDELINTLHDVHLDNGQQNLKDKSPKALISAQHAPPPTTKVTAGIHRPRRGVNPSIAQDTVTVKQKEEREWLLPLITEFGKGSHGRLEIESWTNVFDSDCELQKIAESSFAEVYRITNEAGSSILKLMSLKPPKGPGSQRFTSIPVEDILSEVIILDMMAEIPGFVMFKGLHLIEGRPPRSFQKAYDRYSEKKPSEFPKPSAYPKSQLFVGIEMADAGVDIEQFQITAVSQIWDIFLSVVVALAKGETEVGFEHRDLHEGNVCVKRVREPAVEALPTKHKANHSGLQVTIIDYTLSRANEDRKVIFRDLEKDADIFECTDTLQLQMYRRMRMWTIFQTYGLNHKLWNRPSNKSDTQKWARHSPFNNVIWIHYVLEYLIGKVTHENPVPDLPDFSKETQQLRTKLDLDLPSYEGGFASALRVLEFCLAQGWIDEDDVNDMESSQLGN